MNICLPLISNDSSYSDGICVKGRVFPLITLVIWTRGVLESSSNLKFPRLFSANDPPLSFGRSSCTAPPIPDYCQSKMKPCNAQKTKSFRPRKKAEEKIPTLQVPTFPAVIRSRWRRGAATGGRRADWDGRRCPAPLRLLSTLSPLFQPLMIHCPCLLEI